MLLTSLTPAAYAREAERLRHIAHRARRCQDVAPAGFAHDRYAARLERQALALLEQRRRILES
jgi:hypothetical protein